MDDVDVASYFDDNSLYVNGQFLNKDLGKLEFASRNIFEWFYNDAMK